MRFELSEIIDIKHGYAFKGKDFSEETTNKILVTPSNIQIGGGFDASREKYFSENVSYPEEYNLKVDDLIVTMTDLSKKGDTLGYPGFIPSHESKTYLHNQRIGKVVIKKPDIINKRYLYFLMRTREYRHHILSEASGTTVKHTAPKKILKFSSELPDIMIQKKVANTLINFEDKISVNNSIISNLEELTHTLFKRWFVDFEFPDEDGKPYKSSGGKMVESELGVLPEGWSIGVVSDLSQLIMGQSPKSNTYNENKEGMPLINGASDFKKDKINPQKYTTDPKRVSKQGDLLFGVRATVGNVTYVDKEYALGRGVGIARPLKEEYNEFLYFHLIQGINALEKSSTGSVYINFTRKDLENMKVTLPNLELMILFHQKVRSFLNKKYHLLRENESLTKLRDILLPKLLTGEIELPETLEVTDDVPVS